MMEEGGGEEGGVDERVLKVQFTSHFWHELVGR